jgi:hypothetical protein
LTTAAVAKAPPSRYFVNPWVDFLAIGLASVIFFLLAKWVVDVNVGKSATVAFYAAWIVNWPHFSATNYRLYGSRVNASQYPVTAILTPILMIGGIAASVASPATVAVCFVKLFLIWSPYHFSGQTIGITLVYARRHGFAIGKVERLVLAMFVYGTFIAQTAAFEAGHGLQPFFGITTPALGIPQQLATLASYMPPVAGGTFIVLMAYRFVVSRQLVPPIVLLPALTQFIWFMPGSAVPAFSAFVPFFHSFQYLFIAWAVNLKEKMDMGAIAPSKGFVIRESVLWGALNICGGAILFFVLPRVLAMIGGGDLGFTEPVLISGVQMHHFFVDGVIWKLKNPKVMSPLGVNIDQLIGAPSVALSDVVPTA